MRKHNYVVGYKGEGQCVYGKKVDNIDNFISLLIFREVQELSKTIVAPRIKTIVYKLTEVKKED